MVANARAGGDPVAAMAPKADVPRKARREIFEIQ